MCDYNVKINGQLVVSDSGYIENDDNPYLFLNVLEPTCYTITSTDNPNITVYGPGASYKGTSYKFGIGTVSFSTA